MSRKIADFLMREKTIEKEYLEVYVYGIELCLSSIISILILIFTSIILNRVIEGFLFYIIFCVTRLFCGGYHAKSYAGCKIVFLAALVVVLILNEMPKEIFSNLWLILWSYYALLVLGFAPIENENKPLEETEKKKYKIISILLSFFWLAIEGLLYVLHSKYLRIIPITLALIATLMLLEINKKNLERRKKNEKRSKKECT